MGDINYPELGDISEQRRWYSDGELFHHPSGQVYRAEKDPSGRQLPNGKPLLVWVLVPEPPK